MHYQKKKKSVSVLKILFGWLSIWLIVTPVYAQSASQNGVDTQSKPVKTAHSQLAYGIGLGRYALNSDSTNSSGLSSTNVGFELYTSYSPSPLTRFELTYNGFNIDDTNSFSTIGVDENGFIELVDSETKARLWKISASLNNQLPASSTEYGVGVGYSILSVDRKIDDCTSCNIDELNLDGGSFVFAHLDFRTTKRSGFELSVSYYLTGDIDNNIIARWKWLSR